VSQREQSGHHEQILDDAALPALPDELDVSVKARETWESTARNSIYLLQPLLFWQGL
jgi:hypothetical protein